MNSGPGGRVMVDADETGLRKKSKNDTTATGASKFIPFAGRFWPSLCANNALRCNPVTASIVQIYRVRKHAASIEETSYITDLNTTGY